MVGKEYSVKSKPNQNYDNTHNRKEENKMYDYNWHACVQVFKIMCKHEMYVSVCVLCSVFG